MKGLAIAALLIVLSACMPDEDVFSACTRMVRSHDHQELLKRLDEERIPYRVGDENWILCRPPERIRISELADRVLGIDGEPELGGVSVSAEDSSGVAAALVRARIPFEAFPSADNTTVSFTWAAHLNIQAMSVVAEELE